MSRVAGLLLLSRLLLAALLLLTRLRLSALLLLPWFWLTTLLLLARLLLTWLLVRILIHTYSPNSICKFSFEPRPHGRSWP